MKKTRNLVFILPLLFSFVSCSKGNEETTSFSTDKVILRKSEGINSLFYIESKEELFNITRYDDALIFVSLPGCKYCAAEREKLETYIYKNETVIYEVTREIYLECYDDESNKLGTYAYMYPKLDGYPYYLYYKNGKLKDTHKGSYSSDQNTFEKEIEDQIYPVNIFYLNDYKRTYYESHPFYVFLKDEDNLLSLDTTYLDQNIKEKEKFTFIVSWRKCNDCSSLYYDVVYEYITKNTDKKIYVYEVDGYFTKKQLDTSSYKYWSDYSLKYSLYDDSFFNLTIDGYKGGYVPTLLTYKNNIFESKEIYLNENTIKRNEDGTFSYQNAFHQECLSLSSNTKVEENDTTSSTYIKATNELKEKCKKIDISKAKEYLNNNL